MANEKFYIVAADALPEVFLRVAEARRMLQVGEADTVGEAACKAGISRRQVYLAVPSINIRMRCSPSRT